MPAKAAKARTAGVLTRHMIHSSPFSNDGNLDRTGAGADVRDPIGSEIDRSVGDQAAKVLPMERLSTLADLDDHAVAELSRREDKATARRRSGADCDRA